MMTNTLASAATSLVGASALIISFRRISDCLESEKESRLGLSGASEKHSKTIGASPVMLTAAYDSN
jgi:hypothetical protein